MTLLRSCLLAISAAGLIAGCTGDESPTGPQQMTRLTILLTDAPDDLEHAWVEINQIYLQGGGGGDPDSVDNGDGDGDASDGDNDDDGDNSKSGRTVLFEGSTGLVDLLTLQDTVLELVKDEPVLPGRYNQLRMVLGEAVVETEAGDVYSNGADHPEGKDATGPLNCPSCSQSGMKVKLPNGGLVVEAVSMIVMVDFDVSESFGKTPGQSGKWVMHPVIKTAQIDTN